MAEHWFGFYLTFTLWYLHKGHRPAELQYAEHYRLEPTLIEIKAPIDFSGAESGPRQIHNK